MAHDDVLRVEHIAKRFGAVVALRDVNLHLRHGESLGLVGDNGSGKSTLIKIVSGFHKPDAGRVFVRGEPVELRSVDHARSLGIECVYQDLALVDQLSVWQNMFLHREILRRPLPFLARLRMRRETRAALDEIGVHIRSLDTPVGHLSGGQPQAIAVARTVESHADIILLDEPLAAMGAKEGSLILEVIGRLREQARVSMILIAHNYAHILGSCDRINLLEDGRIAFDKRAADTSVEELTHIIVEEYRQARLSAAPPVGVA